MIKILLNIKYYQFLFFLKKLGRQKENAFSFAVCIFFTFGFSWSKIIAFFFNESFSKIIVLFIGTGSTCIGILFFLWHYKNSEKIWFKINNPQTYIDFLKSQEQLKAKKASYESFRLHIQQKIQTLFLLMLKKKKINKYNPKKKLL